MAHMTALMYNCRVLCCYILLLQIKPLNIWYGFKFMNIYQKMTNIAIKLSYKVYWSVVQSVFNSGSKLYFIIKIPETAPPHQISFKSL
jgi:hypothetical protein